jgi:4-hydroxybenzoate polyprenyltransferase
MDDHNGRLELTGSAPWTKVSPMLPSPVSTPSEAGGIPWSALGRLIRLENQTGTLLLLLPTLWSLVLAERGLPSFRLVLIFSAGAFLMRSAGVILNDLADRSVDRHVARTQRRPLASGELSVRPVLLLLGILLITAAGLVLLLNRLTLLLTPIAMVLAGLYPFAKRVINVPQAALGVAFGWGAIMAWAAVAGRVDPPAWCVFGSTIAWAIAYDTIYAIQDREDDRRLGVKSAAIFFGSRTWLAVGTAFVFMLVLIGTAGRMAECGWAFFAVLLGVGMFFATQVRQLRKPLEPGTALAMFRAHVWAGCAILAGLLAGFLI